MGPGIRVDASKAGDRELTGATATASDANGSPEPAGDAPETAAEPATA
jgi:hypothetical protein